MLGRFSSTSQNRENQISWNLTVQSQIEILIGFEFRSILRYKFKLRFHLIEFAVDQNLPTIQDFDYHLVQHFESHLPRNGLYPLPAPMNHVNFLRADSAEMPFQNWYTANTNHFLVTDFCQFEIKNTTGLSNKHRTV